MSQRVIKPKWAVTSIFRISSFISQSDWLCGDAIVLDWCVFEAHASNQVLVDLAGPALTPELRCWSFQQLHCVESRVAASSDYDHDV